ncbi:MAG: hypothetical protein ACRCUJ_04150 [Phocaeicola sp.]
MRKINLPHPPPFILPPNYLQLPETIVSLYNRYTSLTSMEQAWD